MAATRARALLAVLLWLCWAGTRGVEGLTFSLDGESVSTDGNARISVTDLPVGTTVNGAFLCRSERTPEDVHMFTNAYLVNDGDTTNTEDSNRIRPSTDNMIFQGWDSYRMVENNRRLHYLRRRNTTSGEGYFTCRMRDDDNTPKGLYILYPISSVEATIEVVSGRTFRVRCTSTGGRALEITVSGPDGSSLPLSSIQPVGTRSWMGSDMYTATTGDIEGGSDGDRYTCSVSSAGPAKTKTVDLRVSPAPAITSLEQTAPTAVRVEWSPPSQPPTPTGYVVRYRLEGGSDDGSVSVGASATSREITGLTNGETYTVSVEATISSNDIIPGVSEETIRLEPPPDPPEGAEVTPDSTSVAVSWEPVEDADRYNVSFTKALGRAQQGLCPGSPHSASLSVEAPTTAGRVSGSISVGEDVGDGTDDMLRAYTTYSITVRAVSDTRGTSGASGSVSVLTPQRGAGGPPSNVRATVDSSTAISVQWDQISDCILVNGLLVKYRVQYTPQPDGETETRNQPLAEGEDYRDSCQTTLNGLTPFTTYSIGVAAVNEEGGVGVYSDPMEETTLEDIPGPVVITPVPSFSTITITWEEPAMPNGVITAYQVAYWLTSSPSLSPSWMDTGLATSFTTPDGQELGTQFTFSVRAFTRIGPGEIATVTASTLTRPPCDGSDSSSCCSCSSTPLVGVVIGVIGAVAGVVVGAISIIIAVFIVKKNRPESSYGKGGMSTDQNPAYGLSIPRNKAAEADEDYKTVETSPAAPQESLYEGVY